MDFFSPDDRTMRVFGEFYWVLDLIPQCHLVLTQDLVTNWETGLLRIVSAGEDGGGTWECEFGREVAETERGGTG